jgi:hypothetical protein
MERERELRDQIDRKDQIIIEKEREQRDRDRQMMEKQREDMEKERREREIEERETEIKSYKGLIEKQEEIMRKNKEEIKKNETRIKMNEENEHKLKKEIERLNEKEREREREKESQQKEVNLDSERMSKMQHFLSNLLPYLSIEYILSLYEKETINQWSKELTVYLSSIYKAHLSTPSLSTSDLNRSKISPSLSTSQSLSSSLSSPPSSLSPSYISDYESLVFLLENLQTIFDQFLAINFESKQELKVSWLSILLSLSIHQITIYLSNVYLSICHIFIFTLSIHLSISSILISLSPSIYLPPRLLSKPLTD